MKNFKHATKSASAMKLAAVASSAIMLAPVAMNSVSSFAAGYLGDPKTSFTAYPAYDVMSVASAYKAGTSLQITTPYLFADLNGIQDIFDKIAAITTNTDTENTTKNYKQISYALGADGNAAKAKADDAYKKLATSKDSVFHQLGLETQNKYRNDVHAINDKISEVAKAQGKTYTDMLNAATALDQGIIERDKAITANKDAQDIKNKKAAVKHELEVFNAAKDKFTAVIALHGDVFDLMQALAKKIAPLTNNGAVDEAAVLAAKAIYAMPAGDKRDAANDKFDTIMGAYLNATLPGRNDASKDGAKAAAAMDAAAEVATKALVALASDNADNSASKQLGVATVNYNPNFGIQIWNKAGQIVRFDAKDAKAWNELHPNNTVKVGDAKKLPGQTSWKVFKNTYTANGTTYYNLGGDQYIDANYVNVNFK